MFTSIIIREIVFLLLFHWSVQQSIADISYSDSNGVILPSLYKQYCCVESNRGKSFVLNGEQLKYLLCPFEIPPSCSHFFTSCSNILKYTPSAESGYNITLANGTTVTVYCDMEGVNCDGVGGWTRVAYLNMSDLTEQCPPGFRLYEQNGTRACGRYSPGCQSVIFPTYNINYAQVCGRVTGYQIGSPDGIHPYHSGPDDIEEAYVDGVSITRSSPRKHIWTFITAIQENSFAIDGSHECPCAPNSPVTPQSFVGNDYFCESGNPEMWDRTTFYIDDPLWDGKQCGLIEKECCNATGIPWFNKVLEQPTTDYIELRVCCDHGTIDEDNPVELYQIYVK